jgi:hypothetical protein
MPAGAAPARRAVRKAIRDQGCEPLAGGGVFMSDPVWPSPNVDPVSGALSSGMVVCGVDMVSRSIVEPGGCVSVCGVCPSPPLQALSISARAAAPMVAIVRFIMFSCLNIRHVRAA